MTIMVYEFIDGATSIIIHPRCTLPLVDWQEGMLDGHLEDHGGE